MTKKRKTRSRVTRCCRVTVTIANSLVPDIKTSLTEVLCTVVAPNSTYYYSRIIPRTCVACWTVPLTSVLTPSKVERLRIRIEKQLRETYPEHDLRVRLERDDRPPE